MQEKKYHTPTLETAQAGNRLVGRRDKIDLLYRHGNGGVTGGQLQDTSEKGVELRSRLAQFVHFILGKVKLEENSPNMQLAALTGIRRMLQVPQ